MTQWTPYDPPGSGGGTPAPQPTITKLNTLDVSGAAPGQVLEYDGTEVKWIDPGAGSSDVFTLAATDPLQNGTCICPHAPTAGSYFLPGAKGVCNVVNSSGADFTVLPPASGSINGGSVAVTVTKGSTVQFTSANGVNWYA